MTSFALFLGCGLLAFSWPASMLLLLAYKKAQLIIIVTSFAFSFLLASLCASLVWLVLPSSVNESPWVMIPIGVSSQWLLRLLFVHGYYRVEGVIRRASHQRIQQESRIGSGSSSSGNSVHRSNSTHNDESNPNEEEESSEKALLFRELNDWSCGLAAGVGFGGMHVVMLYGTLLSNESRNLGTLYQDSCESLPTVLHGALDAFFFSVLDGVFMLVSFHGMRLWNKGGSRSSSPYSSSYEHDTDMDAVMPVDATRRQAKVVLSSVWLFHLTAAFVTLFNINDNGCLASLPLLFVVVLGALFYFVRYIQPHYFAAYHHASRIGVVD